MLWRKKTRNKLHFWQVKGSYQYNSNKKIQISTGKKPTTNLYPIGDPIHYYKIFKGKKHPEHNCGQHIFLSHMGPGNAGQQKALRAAQLHMFSLTGLCSEKPGALQRPSGLQHRLKASHVCWNPVTWFASSLTAHFQKGERTYTLQVCCCLEALT